MSMLAQTLAESHCGDTSNKGDRCLWPVSGAKQVARAVQGPRRLVGGRGQTRVLLAGGLCSPLLHVH